MSINREHAVAWSESCGSRRAGREDVGDNRIAFGGRFALSEVLLNIDTQPASREMTVDLEVGQKVLHHVDWDREPDSLGLTDDRGVHPHHFPAHVEERPTRVARVDQGIGLQKVVEHSNPDHPLLGRDDSLRDGLLETKWIADRNHPVADIEFVGVAQITKWKVP